jgi:hypothetical protein
MSAMDQPAPADEVAEVERVAASIYGTIVAASVMVAGADHFSVPQIVLAVIVTVAVYWLAETYARVLAERVTAVPATIREHAIRHARHHWPMVTASVAPLAALVTAASLGAEADEAVVVALIFTTLWLGLLGWFAAGRAEMRGLVRAVATVVAGAAGLAMIALKFALH